MNAVCERNLDAPVARDFNVLTIWHRGTIKRPPDLYSVAAGMSRLVAEFCGLDTDLCKTELVGEERLQVKDARGNVLTDYRTDSEDKAELNLFIQVHHRANDEALIARVSGLFYRVYGVIPVWSHDPAQSGWKATLEGVSVAGIWPAVPTP